MKYAVTVRSNVIIYADTTEEAIVQVSNMIEDVRKRSCGDVGDEILANTEIVKAKIEKSDDE